MHADLGLNRVHMALGTFSHFRAHVRFMVNDLNFSALYSILFS